MRFRRLFFIFGCAMLHAFLGFGQNKPEEAKLLINKTISPITLDGILNEEVWQIADKAKDFWQYSPVDTIPSISATEVMLTFDEENLYVGAIMYDTLEGDYIISSLRRDFSWIINDNFSIYLDPMNDQTNGFTFQVSALNVQREGTIVQSSEINDDWDNKWYSAVEREEGQWTVEMKIPFKSFRYSERIKEWRITFLRNNRKANEIASWTKVPRQFVPNHLGFAGKLIWQQAPPKAGTNISIIPYIAGSAAKDFEANTDTKYNFDAGFDAKIALTSSLNLDLTFNPDFSQVEVDQQVANLDRFEIFFPERRQFFLENSDLFANFGVPPIRPFFSRRIGITRGPDGNNLAVPILYGARLSGKLDQNWRVGFLNMQTAKNDDINLPGRNYTVATFQRRFMERSNFGGIFVNKQAVNFDSENPDVLGSRYNRVAGFDFNYVSNSNRWEISTRYHHTFTSESDNKESYAWINNVGYNSRNFNFFFVNEFVGSEFNAEVGFVPRTGFIKNFAEISTPIYTQNNWLVSHGPEFFIYFLTDLEGNLSDRRMTLGYNFELQNNSEFGVEVGQEFVRLLDNFDPSNTDGPEIQAGERFTWEYIQAYYNSDPRKLFNYELGIQYGGFFNGEGYQLEGSINYRYQPYGGIAMAFNYSNIDFPDEFNDAKFWLVGPRIDFTFTDNLFFTTFIQYNEQVDNLNINSRLQWRFKPVSDVFLVYTDNYLPPNFEVKNRALVLKISYWLNL